MCDHPIWDYMRKRKAFKAMSEQERQQILKEEQEAYDMFIWPNDKRPESIYKDLI